MKKIVVTLICALMMLSGVQAYAFSQEDWDLYSGNGALSEITDDCVRLSVAAPKGQSSAARAVTEFSANGGKVYMSMSFSVDDCGVSGFMPDRTVYLAPKGTTAAKPGRMAMLVCISGSSILVGDDYDELNVQVSDNKEHVLCFGISEQDGTVDIWLDGEFADTAEISGIPSMTDGACAVFENTYAPDKKRELSSEFCIYDFYASHRIQPQPAVNKISDTRVEIELGAICTAANARVWTGVEYGCTFMQHKIVIDFAEPLSDEASCRLSLENVQPLAGGNYSFELWLNEKSFSLPKSGVYTLDELTDFSAETDAKINGVSYYVDSEFVGRAVTAPYEIDLSRISLGMHTVAAAAQCGELLLWTDTVITAAAEREKTMSDCDFENFEHGSVTVNASNRLVADNSLFTTYKQNDYSFISCEAVNKHEKALTLGCDNPQSNVSALIAACGEAYRTLGVFESQVLFFDANASTTLAVRGTNSDGATTFLENVIFTAENERMWLEVLNGSEKIRVCEIDTYRWYDLRYEFDMEKQSYCFWIDGVIVAENYSFAAELVSLQNMVRFYTAYKKDTSSKMAVDNIRLTVREKSICPSAASAARGSRSVTIDFEGSLDGVCNKIAVTKDGREVEVSSFTFEEERLTINFAEPLDETGLYSVNLDCMNIYGKTVRAEFEIDTEARITIVGDAGIAKVKFVPIYDDSELIYIVNRFRGGKIVDSFVKVSGQGEFETDTISYEDGDCFKAYILSKNPIPAPYSDTMSEVTLYR